MTRVREEEQGRRVAAARKALAGMLSMRLFLVRSFRLLSIRRCVGLLVFGGILADYGQRLTTKIHIISTQIGIQFACTVPVLVRQKSLPHLLISYATVVIGVCIVWVLSLIHI